MKLNETIYNTNLHSVDLDLQIYRLAWGEYNLKYGQINGCWNFAKGFAILISHRFVSQMVVLPMIE